MRRGFAIAAGIAACLIAGAAMTQTDAPKAPPRPQQKAQQKPQGAKKTPAPAARAQPASSEVAMPDAEKIVLLLRNTLITLNDALQTGNFTVLRDRAAPGFRDANSAARLGQIFADLSARRIDLSTVTIVTPQLSEQPVLDQGKGMLRLKGYFLLRPQPISFEVLYQSVGGRWRLFGLSVQPVAVQQPQAQSGLPPPPAPPPN